jgi:hypothetical protein
MIRKLSAALLAAALLAALVTPAAAARRVSVFSTVLTGAAEAPGPGDPNAFGLATVLIQPETDKICWAVFWTKVDGTVTMAHIHGPAPVGSPAGIRVILFMDEMRRGTGIDVGCIVDSDADAIAANPELHYVNVHSLPDFGAGAIRGQLD